LSAQGIQTAGDLLVDIRASDASSVGEGGKVTSWQNNGTLLGSFVNAIAGQGPVYNANIGGYAAVTFAGSANSIVTNTVTPPASICAGNDWTVEAWVFNPAFSTTTAEDVLAWTGRNAWPGGVANGSCMEVRFGYDANILEHYGYNVPWGTMPTANFWHHIAATRDSLGVERIYADGKLVNVNSPTTVNLRTDGSFSLGGVRDFAQTNTAAAWVYLYSGSIGRVRIHEGQLSSAGVIANYVGRARQLRSLRRRRRRVAGRAR
jgi:hypothetical protein